MDIRIIQTLIMELVSAFFGFLFAMLLNSYLYRQSERKQNDMIIKSFCEELKDIEWLVDDYIFKSQIPKTAIQIPDRDTVVNSGLLLKLIRSEYYIDLVRCYSHIMLLNEDIKQNDNNENGSCNVERLRIIDESIQCLNQYLGFFR